MAFQPKFGNQNLPFSFYNGLFGDHLSYFFFSFGKQILLNENSSILDKNNMCSIVLENKIGIWLLRTDSQLEFGHHTGEFGHQQCDTLGSSTGRISRNPNLITFFSVYGKHEADHPPFSWFSDAVFGRVTPS